MKVFMWLFDTFFLICLSILENGSLHTAFEVTTNISSGFVIS